MKRRSMINGLESKHRSAFKEADRDGSGKVDFQELLQVLHTLGKNTKEEEARKFFKEVDKDGSGLIDVDEFVVMMDMIENAWVGIQRKTFTRWTNTCLSERLLSIKDLQTDLCDGLILAPLLEILSGKVVGKPNPKPKLRVHKLENLQLSMSFLARERIKLVNIGGDDIEQGNLKIILGLIWTLILNYQICASGGQNNPKAVLLEWVKKQVAPYGVGQDLQNFRNGWSDGRVLSALTDSMGPLKNQTIDNNRLEPDALRATSKAIATAESAFAIPPVVDAADVVENPEEHSIMTYVSYFRDFKENKAKNDKEAEAAAKRRADPQYCVAYGPGLEGGFSNEEGVFTIEARNLENQPLAAPDPSATFDVHVDGPEPVAVKIGSDGAGKHPCSYLPRVPGRYQLTITCNGEPIKDAVRVVEIAGPDAGRSFAFGPGVEGDEAKNKKTNFTIRAMRPNGKPVGHGGDPFNVLVTDPLGNHVPAQVSDMGSGDYAVSYPLGPAGEYEVAASLEGEPLRNSPYHALVAGGSAKNSYAEGPGLQGGKVRNVLSFTIHSVTSEGKPFLLGGDNYRVEVTGPFAALECDVVDNADGTYSATYMPTHAGPHKIAVLLGKDHIKNSPATATVKPGVEAEASWAEGPGLEKAFEEQPNTFTVFARDDQGNPVAGAPPKVSVRALQPVPARHGLSPPQALGPSSSSSSSPSASPRGSASASASPAKSGPSAPASAAASPVKSSPSTEVPVAVKDNGDGSYSVVYMPVALGPHVVDATYDDLSVTNCPKEINVLKAVDADASWAEGPGLERPLEKRPNAFLVHARDLKGEPIANRPPDVIIEPLNGGERLPAVVTDKGNGCYEVVFEPELAGPVVVDAQYDGQSVRNCPKQVDVLRGVDPSKSWAEGPGLEQAFDNQPNNFTVFARDDLGKPVFDRPPEVVIRPLDGGQPVPARVTDNGDGSYDVGFEPEAVGPHVVDATYDGVPVTNCPKELNVLKSVDLLESWAEGPGLEKAFDNRPSTFLVFARDDKGKAVLNRPPEVTMDPIRGGGPVVPTVTDNQDGSYTVVYEAFKAGKYRIDARYENGSVQNLPREVEVVEGADENDIDGGTFRFTIKAKNKYGNVKTEGGDDFRVRVTGPDQPDGSPLEVHVMTQDNGDGSYSAEYSLQFTRVSDEPQEFKVRVELNGKNIKGSPFKQYF